MNRIIGVTELQRKFSAIFDDVAKRHMPYILTRGSRPEVVMIPYEQYLKYVQLDEKGHCGTHGSERWLVWPN